MKITELKCPNCGAPLKVKEENLNLGECEACGGKFSLEWDNPVTPQQLACAKPLQQTNSSAQSSQSAPAHPLPKRLDYTPVPVGRTSGKSSRSFEGFQRLIFSLLGIAALFFMAFLFRMAEQSKDPDNLPNTPGQQESYKPSSSPSGPAASSGTTPAKKTEITGYFADFVKIVYGRPAEDVSPEELARIQWLEISSDLDYKYFRYSFENPYENPEAQLTEVKFPRDSFPSVSLDCLPAFTGLKLLDVPGKPKKEQLTGLSLQAFGGRCDSLKQVSELLADPRAIRKLSVTGSPFSLEGIDLFPNLETLIINSSELQEEKLLVKATSLKSLSVDLSKGSMDFSTFGVMTWLEELSLSSKELKDIGFVTKMDGLKSLCLENCPLLTLDPLKDNLSLTGLSVKSCSDLKDMSAVSSLTGLKTLELSLPYKCPQPDLSSLTGITQLKLVNFDDVSFLKDMSDLETLTLSGCTPGDASNFTGLKKLKTLSCVSAGYFDQDFSFIPSLPALEKLDLHGTVTYGDISGIFNLPTLKELDISSMQCEIAFDKISENTTLEKFSIDKITLYENVFVSESGGFVDVYYDKVNIAEHTDFLKHLKGLKTLSICRNELTDISFAASLEALEEIDLTDNYVTDLSPLSPLKNLRRVNCTGNPVSNFDVLGDTVAVVR